MSDQQLRKILDFDESDLKANRAGRLTARQNADVSRSERLDAIISVVLGIIFLVITGFMVVRPITDLLAGGVSFAGPSAEGPKILVILLIGLLLGVCALASFVRAFNKLNRGVIMRQGKVGFEKVEERVEHRDNAGNMRFSHMDVRYEMQLGSFTFSSVDEGLVAIMKSGDTYSVYYVPGYGIVSAELMK